MCGYTYCLETSPQFILQDVLERQQKKC